MKLLSTPSDQHLVLFTFSPARAPRVRKTPPTETAEMFTEGDDKKGEGFNPITEPEFIDFRPIVVYIFAVI